MRTAPKVRSLVFALTTVFVACEETTDLQPSEGDRIQMSGDCVRQTIVPAYCINSSVRLHTAKYSIASHRGSVSYSIINEDGLDSVPHNYAGHLFAIDHDGLGLTNTQDLKRGTLVTGQHAVAVYADDGSHRGKAVMIRFVCEVGADDCIRYVDAPFDYSPPAPDHEAPSLQSARKNGDTYTITLKWPSVLVLGTKMRAVFYAASIKFNAQEPCYTRMNSGFVDSCAEGEEQLIREDHPPHLLAYQASIGGDWIVHGETVNDEELGESEISFTVPDNEVFVWDDRSDYCYNPDDPPNANCPMVYPMEIASLFARVFIQLPSAPYGEPTIHGVLDRERYHAIVDSDAAALVVSNH